MNLSELLAQSNYILLDQTSFILNTEQKMQSNVSQSITKNKKIVGAKGCEDTEVNSKHIEDLELHTSKLCVMKKSIDSTADVLDTSRVEDVLYDIVSLPSTSSLHHDQPVTSKLRLKKTGEKAAQTLPHTNDELIAADVEVLLNTDDKLAAFHTKDELDDSISKCALSHCSHVDNDVNSADNDVNINN
ncbi:uncharacterized protein LOC108674866 [Hyalella azteca]|uniref:Uncharacterized protein LOC108674866 n=1 Tax=Hyalella azteca TaxID=294128 RepID=A0A8B7NX93_HYAAZ|nr:uncharacterized protein LOC108674866 [Hyalella azteca]